MPHHRPPRDPVALHRSAVPSAGGRAVAFALASAAAAVLLALPAGAQSAGGAVRQPAASPTSPASPGASAPRTPVRKSSTPPKRRSRAMSQPGKPEVVVSSRMGGPDEPVEGVARTAAEWAALARRAGMEAEGWSKAAGGMLVLVAVGQQPSGGHSVTVDEVVREGSGVVVRYTHARPGPDCMSTMALTSPYVVARVPAMTGTVRFVKREQDVPCG